MAKRHYIPVTADVPGAASEGNCALIRKVIRTALAAEGVDFPCEVDVLLTNDRNIRQINLDMRNVDAPTDVLSFPELELSPGRAARAGGRGPGHRAGGSGGHGDLHGARGRSGQGVRHAGRRELAYLVTHSVLHLLGYDHLDEGEMKAQMRSREEAVLAELGIGR